MKLYSENEDYKLYEGSMLDMLEIIEPNSIDSIITDPPYELNFMGKGWDNSGIAFQSDTWKKCYDVLKPGGYLLAFGGSRTFHRIAVAIEDAGFEIRDTIMWLYGSGFPKSMSLSKGLEAREKLGNAGTRNKRKIEQSCDTESYTLKQTNNGAMGKMIETTRKKYIPNSKLAEKWQGWGTCLKPSFEPIIVARKPFKGSLVDNVIEYGVGGINIDECRVGNEELHNSYAGNKNTGFTSGDLRDEKGKGMFSGNKQGETVVNGRFPANTILTYDDNDFDEVCGGFPIGGKNGSISKPYKINNQIYGEYGDCKPFEAYNDSGSASRYFYCAKASKKDRDEGLDNFESKPLTLTENKGRTFNDRCAICGKKFIGSPETICHCEHPITDKTKSAPRKNVHPTVKPCDLMQYLIRLVTPNGGVILDPFNGSGSTGKAAMYENRERNKDYKYIGIELTEEYLPIAKARIEYAGRTPLEILKKQTEEITEGQTSIFDFMGDD